LIKPLRSFNASLAAGEYKASVSRYGKQLSLFLFLFEFPNCPFWASLLLPTSTIRISPEIHSFTVYDPKQGTSVVPWPLASLISAAACDDVPE